MTEQTANTPVWDPSAERVARSRLAAFVRALEQAPDLAAGSPDEYAALWAWSVEDPERFWPAVARFTGLRYEVDPAERDVAGFGLDRMAPPDAVLGPRWFPAWRLNFSDNLLRFADERTALVSWTEQGRQRAMTYRELTDAVTRLAAALHDAGVQPGDRVAGWMPNIPETVVAMLAATRLGAVWSSCSPDFGEKGVVDRFGQIAPRILFAADEYRYAGKRIDCLERLRGIVSALPSVEHVVVVPYGGEAGELPGVRGAVWYEAFVGGSAGGVGPPPTGMMHRAAGKRPILLPPTASFRRPRGSSRSTTPSTSCTRQARPACRNAWSTAPAAPFCSTPRSSCCTPTSRATT
jgi:acetoacetyl-CoA synthetase